MSRNAFVYAAIISGSLGISLDFASVDLALPALERQFGLDLESVQWVINGYVLAFSVLMVTGGKLADAYGRKRVFLIGMGIFAAASLLGGSAWSGESVIFFRVLQGVGAAMLWPAMIGMACAAVGDARRAFALGLIFGTCSVGNAAGPVVGGALTQWFSWRWVLWINVPMALFAMLVTAWSIPKDRDGGERPRNDYAGMIFLTSGLVALMLVVYQGQPWGWGSARTLGLIAATVILLGAFFFAEQRSRDALIPPDLMRSPEFMTLCACVMVICQLFFIVLLYFTQYAMKFLGDDPMWAGMRVVQFMLSYGLVSYFGGPLSAFFGSRCLLLGGLCCAAVASVLLGIFGPGASWLAFNGSLVLLGFGVGAVIPTVNSRAIETVGTARAGLVSGITFMCQLSGSAVMLAINTAIFAAVSSGILERLFTREGVSVTAEQQAVITAVMVGAEDLAALSPQTAAGLRDLGEMVTQAYQGGLQAVLWLSAALTIAALVLVLRFVPDRTAAKPAG